jgi:hypothetical protein
MNQQALLAFLQDQSVDLAKFSEDRSNLTVSGTFVSGAANVRDDSQLRLLFEDSKWRIDFTSHREAFQSLPFPLEDWSYSCTFLQFAPDICFFSSASQGLALAAATIALINKDERVPASSLNPSYLSVFLIADRALSRIRVLFTKSATEILCTFVENVETFTIYTVNHGIYQIAFVLIPYLEVKHDSAGLPPVPCFYPLDLPDRVWSGDNLDGIVQGIRELSQRIRRAESELEVAEETSLEITKQKMLTDIGRLECEIELRKESLAWELNQPNSELLEQVMRTVSPAFTVAGSLDFQQQYSIPGKTAAAQIMKLALAIRQ